MSKKNTSSGGANNSSSGSKKNTPGGIVRKVKPFTMEIPPPPKNKPKPNK